MTSGCEVELSNERFDTFIEGSRAYSDFLEQEFEGVDYFLPDGDDVQDRIKKIFKASFPISNGSPLVQFLLQSSSLGMLSSHIGQDTMMEAFDDIELNPREFYPPRRHAPVDAERLDGRIYEIWGIYEDIAYNIGDTELVEETTEMPDDDWLLFKKSLKLGLNLVCLWTRLCERDLNYLQHGRPSGGSDLKHYKSIVKRHIIDAKTTGSEEIDLVCLAVRATLKYALDPNTTKPDKWVAYEARRDYNRLSSFWERRHDLPGEFSTLDFAPLVGMPILSENISGDEWHLIT